MPVPVIVIFAPTACGKTALAGELFGRGGLSRFKGRGEVVSADSQAVYRYMDIGTAKPSPQEAADLPHHLVDVVDPDVQFGVGDFVERADAACADIWARGHIPVVVGGSGFYIRCFMLGLPSAPEGDPGVRREVRARLAREGAAALHAELARVDAVSAARIAPRDSYRVCRALEVYLSSGRPLSSFRVPSSPREGYSFSSIILSRPREELYARIGARVERMFAAGLPDEVASLLRRGYGPDCPGMRAIGYGEFFEGGRRGPPWNLAAVRERVALHSRQYAKKQYAYMRGIPGAATVAADDVGAALGLVSEFCAREGV